MKVLSTERLVLRWLEHHDSDFIIELLNDRSFIDNIADRGVRTTDDAVKYIDKLRGSYIKDGYGFFLVLDHAENKLGICGIIKRAELEEPDVGFAFLPAYSKKGYAFEATKEVLDGLLNSGEHATILATTIPENSSSIQLLRKLGFSFSKEIINEGELLQVFAKNKNEI